MAATVAKAKMNNIDLNNAYDDSEDCMENLQGSDGPMILGKASPGCPLWVYQDPHKYSPPQTWNDRIVYKLFGKYPSDFPLVLRKQLFYELSSNLRRLLDASEDSFWQTGWIYTRVRHRVAFIYDGINNLLTEEEIFLDLDYLESKRSSVRFEHRSSIF